MPENQTVWKPENQGVKEETFISTGRRVEMGSWGREDAWQGDRPGRQVGNWKTRWFHNHVQISWEEQLGSKTDRAMRVPECEKLNPQNLWL